MNLLFSILGLVTLNSYASESPDFTNIRCFESKVFKRDLKVLGLESDFRKMISAHEEIKYNTYKLSLKRGNTLFYNDSVLIGGSIEEVELLRFQNNRKIEVNIFTSLYDNFYGDFSSNINLDLKRLNLKRTDLSHGYEIINRVTTNPVETSQQSVTYSQKNYLDRSCNIKLTLLEHKACSERTLVLNKESCTSSDFYYSGKSNSSTRKTVLSDSCQRIAKQVCQYNFNIKNYKSFKYQDYK